MMDFKTNEARHCVARAEVGNNTVIAVTAKPEGQQRYEYGLVLDVHGAERIDPEVGFDSIHDALGYFGEKCVMHAKMNKIEMEMGK